MKAKEIFSNPEGRLSLFWQVVFILFLTAWIILGGVFDLKLPGN